MILLPLLIISFETVFMEFNRFFRHEVRDSTYISNRPHHIRIWLDELSMQQKFLIIQVGDHNATRKYMYREGVIYSVRPLSFGASGFPGPKFLSIIRSSFPMFSISTPSLAASQVTKNSSFVSSPNLIMVGASA